MSKLRSVKHEQFCEHVACGLSYAEPYRQFSGNNKNADVHSAEWIKRCGVKARISELRAENERKSELSREEALRWLAALIRAPAGSVGKDSPLVQSYEEDSEGNVKVRLADKIAGLQTLCKMVGWNKPERVELGASDTLHAYILELRARPIGTDVIELEPTQQLETASVKLENGQRNGC
jgi:hypothetical protein